MAGLHYSPEGPNFVKILSLFLSQPFIIADLWDPEGDEEEGRRGAAGHRRRGRSSGGGSGGRAGERAPIEAMSIDFGGGVRPKSLLQPTPPPPDFELIPPPPAPPFMQGLTD